MTAAETIATAVEKLEGIQTDATWVYSPENMDLIANGVSVAVGVMPADGARIVMLHRTIDAQLAILRELCRPALGGSVHAAALELARAILGED